jgi:Rrf2 family cysteine metabolism transcriptional repressor
MRFSTKGRYGVRALLDVALNSGQGPVLLKDVARRQGISAQYLEHLISPLIKAGFLRSMRGARGGLTMAKPPGEIRLSRVIEILEGSIAPVECVDNPQICPRSDYCVTRDVWEDMKRAMLEVLDSLTVEDLMERHRRKEKTRSSAEDIYAI